MDSFSICRYIRVFSDGTILMYNTPDEPTTVVGKMKYKNCPLAGVMVGHYRIVADVVSSYVIMNNSYTNTLCTLQAAGNLNCHHSKFAKVGRELTQCFCLCERPIIC